MHFKGPNEAHIDPVFGICQAMLAQLEPGVPFFIHLGPMKWCNTSESPHLLGDRHSLRTYGPCWPHVGPMLAPCWPHVAQVEPSGAMSPPFFTSVCWADVCLGLCEAILSQDQTLDRPMQPTLTPAARSCCNQHINFSPFTTQQNFTNVNLPCVFPLPGHQIHQLDQNRTHLRAMFGQSLAYLGPFGANLIRS